MFPKKIIGKYLGNDINGILIGNIRFRPNTYIECNVNEDMFNQILILCTKGSFYLFEYASVNKVIEITDNLHDDINESLSSIVDEIVDVEEDISKLSKKVEEDMLELSEKVDIKYDDVSIENNELSFYSNEVVIKTISLPVPDRPREIEIGKNDTHLTWRYKAIGKEFIPWENIVSLAKITGPAYDDTSIKKSILNLTSRIKVLEDLKEGKNK